MTEQTDDMAVLSAASWPALLVDSAACVRHINSAASEFFGPKVEGGNAALTALWTNENGTDAAGFLEKVSAAKALTAPLKLRGKGITITPFNASVCMLERDGAK